MSRLQQICPHCGDQFATKILLDVHYLETMLPTYSGMTCGAWQAVEEEVENEMMAEALLCG